MKKIILLYLTAISLIGCNSIARKINGEKKRKKETIASLKNYVEDGNFKISIEDCLFLKDQKTIELLSTYHKYYTSENYSTSPRNLFTFYSTKNIYWLMKTP